MFKTGNNINYTINLLRLMKNSLPFSGISTTTQIYIYIPWICCTLGPEKCEKPMTFPPVFLGGLFGLRW